MECEKLETLEDYVKKYPEGFDIPDHLRPPEFPKKPDCRRCPKGYIIPEQTKAEIQLKGAEDKIKKQEETINTLLAHLSKLTEQVNQITVKLL